MHAQLTRALKTTLVAGGLIVAGAVAAQADDSGILSGPDIEAPVSAPVDVTGLAVGVLGDATSTTPAAPAPATAPTASTTDGDSDGVASGAAVAAPVNAPVDASGVALGVLGDASSTTGSDPAPAPAAAPSATAGSGDSDGIASGAGAAAPVNIPVTIDGLAVGVGGDATSTSDGQGTGSGSAPTATVGGDSADGALSGLGAAAPVNAPITIGNVSLGVLGDASSTGGTDGTTGTTEAPTADVASGDTNGVASGAGVAAPVNAPISIGNVSLGVLGDASSTGGTDGTTGTTEAPTADVQSGDSDGIASSAGVAAPVNAPVTVQGLALGVLGDAATTGATDTGDGTTEAPTADVASDDGDGIASDAGVAAPVNAPVTVQGLALGVLGNARTASFARATRAPAAVVDSSGTSTGLLSSLSIAAPVNAPVTIGGTALGLLGDAAVTAPSTGSTTPGDDDTDLGEGGTDPDGTDPGTTAGGTVTADTGSGTGTDVTTVANLSTGVLGTDRAAALLASAFRADAMTLPAALAPTGSSTGLLSLVAAALLALGALLRRAPHLALV